MPLADVIRPNKIEDVIGQKHIIGEGKILNRMSSSKNPPNIIFYGPPGCGKTTVANIIAKNSGKTFYKLNATNASLKDVKDVIGEINSIINTKGILLYLDEIQNFNKKQQQSLLEFIEDGSITLIASTTENPYFYVYNAILSRSIVCEFKLLTLNEVKLGIDRAIEIWENEHIGIKINLSEDGKEYIANASNGDLRRAINFLELAIESTKIKENVIFIYLEDAITCCGTKGVPYDKKGDNHYDVLSAFQKSIRGSDANASLHYLARLIKSGDIQSICRRLLVIAAEDIGVAHPQAIAIVKACVDSAMQLGFPEARIPLAEAVIFLSTAPKSNSVINGIDEALKDLESLEVGDIPQYLKDGHYEGAKVLGRMEGYKYPHNYKNNYIKQEYLPENLRKKVYYKYGENKMEQAAKVYWDNIKI